jgi:hypothetical protein
MGLRQLLWRRRWVLLLGAVISAAAAMPALLNARTGYTSEAEVLVALAEPIEPPVRGVTPLAEALSAYEEGDLRADLQAELGEDAGAIRSVDVTVNRDEGLHVIGIEATSREAASRGALAAADLVVEKSHRLGLEQVENLDARVAANLDSLQAERYDAHRDRDRARQDGLQRAEAVDFRHRIEVIQSKRQGLLDLVRGAITRLAIRQTTTQIVRGPTVPESNLPTRVIETVGLALVVGVVVATLTILWLERRSLMPPGAPPGSSADGHVVRGPLRPGAARSTDEQTESGVVRR